MPELAVTAVEQMKECQYARRIDSKHKPIVIGPALLGRAVEITVAINS